MAIGDEILSQQVISAAGLHNTYGKLLPDAVGTRLKLRRSFWKMTMWTVWYWDRWLPRLLT